jgi:DNA-binding CsgD family transcriptional regulator
VVSLDPRSRLVGRSEELGRIDGLLSGAREGQSGALVVRGEPGVGKTCVLDYAISRAGDFGLLRAVGAESESDLAYSGLHQLLRASTGRFGELPAAQAAALGVAFGGSGQADRYAVFAAVLGMIAMLADDGPLLCVMDDAQWVDPASREALLFATRRLSDEGVVVLFGARDGEATYFEARGVAELALTGLQPLDAVQLVHESSRFHVAPAVVARIVAETNGNPLALVEIPGALPERQRLGIEPLEDPLRGGAVVERAFGARVGTLSLGAQRALLIAAVSDSDDLPTIILAAAHDGDCLDEAERAGLIVLEQQRLGFRHPLVRSAIHGRSTGGARRGAHAALAEVLVGVDEDRAIWHRALATSGYDEDVASALVAMAGRARRRGGAESESRLLERSARLTADAERQASRLLAAGVAAYHAGRGESAGALLDEALERAADPLVRADIVNARTYVARAQGEITDWIGPCLEHAAAIEARDPQRASQLLTQVWDYSVEQYEVEQARALLDRIIALAVGQLDDLHTVAARAWQAMVENDVAEARAATARGATLTTAQSVEFTIELGFVLVYLGDCEGARALIEPLIARFRRESSLFDLIKALLVLAYLERRRGRLAEADAAATESCTLAAETGLVYWECGGLGIAIATAALLGRDEAVVSIGERALELAPRVGLRSTTTDTWHSLGVSALATGKIDEAIDALERCRDELCGVPGVHFFWEPDLVEAYVRAGRVDDAHATLTGLERLAARSKHELAPMEIARCRALLAGESDADAAFDEALRLCDDDRWPIERGRTLLADGERLRRVGSRVRARTRLHEALAIFDRIGAAGLAARTRNELRATGETVATRLDPDQLTPQELQVAQLVGAGATNREAAASLFLSPKTIEKHLSSVYRKLGVRSRTELARTLVDR